MKIGIKVMLEILEDWRVWVLIMPQRAYLRMKRTNQFVFTIFGEKLQLELLEDHKYWHVGEVECC